MEAAMQQLLEKLGPTFSESMGSVFSMLTGREFAVQSKVGGSVDHAAIDALMEGSTIIIKANYTKSVNGVVFFALPLKGGAMLVDLMLGGEGAPANELTGDSRDALAETFNQILGSANQTLSDMAGETVSISNVEILTIEKGDISSLKEMLGAAPFLQIELPTLQDVLEARIHMLLPEALAEQMLRKLGMIADDGSGAIAAPGAEVRATSSSHAAASATASAPAAAAPLSGAGGTVGFAQAVLQRQAPNVDTGNLDLLLDIELPVMVRMGQTEMQLGELLKLTPGSILELNRAADAPVDLLVNGKQIAKGEVVVVDGNFAFRITEIESTDARIRSLG